MPTYATSLYPSDLAHVVDFLAGSLANYHELSVTYPNANSAAEVRNAIIGRDSSMQDITVQAGNVLRVDSMTWSNLHAYVMQERYAEQADVAQHRGPMFRVLGNFMVHYEKFRASRPVPGEHYDFGPGVDVRWSEVLAGQLVFDQQTRLFFNQLAVTGLASVSVTGGFLPEAAQSCFSPELVPALIEQGKSLSIELNGTSLLVCRQETIEAMNIAAAQMLTDHLNLLIRLAMPTNDRFHCAAFKPPVAAALIALLENAVRLDLTQFKEVLDAFNLFRSTVEKNPALSTAEVTALRTNAIRALLSGWSNDFLETCPWMRSHYQNWLAYAPRQISRTCLLYPLSHADPDCVMQENAVLRTGSRIKRCASLPAGWIVEKQCTVRRLSYGAIDERSVGSVLTGDLTLGKTVTFKGPVYFGKNVAIKTDWHLPSGVRITDGARIEILAASCVPPNTVIRGSLRLGKNCTVGKHCEFGADVEIGMSCRLGPSSSVGDFVKIADDISVGAHCRIEDGIYVKKDIKSNCVVTLRGIFDRQGRLLIAMPRLADVIGKVVRTPLKHHARYLKTIPLPIVDQQPADHAEVITATRDPACITGKRTAAQIFPAPLPAISQDASPAKRPRLLTMAGPVGMRPSEFDNGALAGIGFEDDASAQRIICLIEAALNFPAAQWNSQVYFPATGGHEYARHEAGRILFPWAPIDEILHAIAARTNRSYLVEDRPPLRTGPRQTTSNWLGFLVQDVGNQTRHLVCKAVRLRNFLTQEYFSLKESPMYHPACVSLPLTRSGEPMMQAVASFPVRKHHHYAHVQFHTRPVFQSRRTALVHAQPMQNKYSGQAPDSTALCEQPFHAAQKKVDAPILVSRSAFDSPTAGVAIPAAPAPYVGSIQQEFSFPRTIGCFQPRLTEI